MMSVGYVLDHVLDHMIIGLMTTALQDVLNWLNSISWVKQLKVMGKGYG